LVGRHCHEVLLRVTQHFIYANLLIRFLISTHYRNISAWYPHSISVAEAIVKCGRGEFLGNGYGRHTILALNACLVMKSKVRARFRASKHMWDGSADECNVIISEATSPAAVDDPV